MQEVMPTEEFISLAKAYRAEMAKTNGLDELHALWRSTNYAYGLKTLDPFSRAYRDEVLSIYESLCDCGYDVDNELTSTLQTPEDFKIGYPWISGNLRVVATEMGKAVQALNVFHQHMPDATDFVEFGSGWGNLAIPLARAQKNVTAIDIDAGFLSRMMNEANAMSVNIDPVQADFLEAAQRNEKKFDIAVFSSSFHHCLDFQDLLVALREKVLKPGTGRIFFMAEPVSDNLSFPWGLRYDGESVWAITVNKWLELGFSETFFREVLDRTGFDAERHQDHTGLMGDYWVARAR